VLPVDRAAALQVGGVAGVAGGADHFGAEPFQST
jgi:hypothetical protein